MNTTELLAPARNLETGTDAVNCGADAVYIGAERFGARNGAENPVADIEKLASYAHKYRAKVYAAVNTIMDDAELARASKLIERLYEAGADAVIIQDMGLLETSLPPIPLFASTQTDNTTPEKVLFLEKAGFKRVILARELSLCEIKAIREQTAVELEAFVHGSLCVSRSGQCYLSYALGGRSGNRGECAQPCRKAYGVTDADGNAVDAGKYPLCLKDLNLSKRLGSLLDAGITSFKIEGRLKDRAYVRNVVAAYRSELDKALAKREMKKASSGQSFIKFIPDLSKTFNRGYTQYFLDGNPKDIASPDTPKFIGEPLGPAYNIKLGSFQVRGQEKLHSGDGICYFDKEGNLTGSLINGIKDGRVRADNLKGMDNGTLLNRNFDRLYINAVEKSQCARKFAVSMEFSECEKGFLLSAEDELGRKAETLWKGKKSSAKKPELAAETIQKQLSKFGETDFYLKDLSVNMSKPYFLPVSALNDLRRETLEKIEKQDYGYERPSAPIKPTEHPYPAEELDFSANVMNGKAADFYKRHGVKKIQKAAELGSSLDGKPLMTMKYCIRRRLGLCKKNKEKAGPLFLKDEKGNTLRMEFNCGQCLINLYAEKDKK